MSIDQATSRRRRESVPVGAPASDYRFPASRKVHLPGRLHPDLRVPMREIALSPTRLHGPRSNGSVEENPPLLVYDTSGPYTDPVIAVDIREGLPRLREPWIRARGQYVETQPSYRPVSSQSDPSLPMPPGRKAQKPEPQRARRALRGAESRALGARSSWEWAPPW